MKVNFSIDWTELSIQWMLTCGHFLWQGFAVAIVFLVIERVAATRASTRYALACTTLLSLPICAMLTFALVHNSRGAVLKKTSPSLDNAISVNDSVATRIPTLTGDSPIDNLANTTALQQTANDRPVNSEAATAQPSSLAQRAIFLAPMIAAAYAIVVGLLLLRISLSLLGSFRFGNAAQRVTDSQFLQVVSAQATRLKLKTVPIVATCVRVSSPVVVGILRPMILLPPSLICGLDPIQLVAILSHEMAHIRRYDLLFNLVQRVIESLFFFHPIVWWLGRRVSIERESCCDDVAASYVGRLTYAEALVHMASICLANRRGHSQALTTLAADGGNSTNFGYRIRRLIDAQETPQIRITKRSFVFCLATMALMGASYLSFAQSPQTQNDESHVSQPSNESFVDGIQWSTWGDHNGLVSGARLILPRGGVHPGQPVVVEYRLKNVSIETKKLKCYVRSNWQYLTLESKNRIRDMGIDTSDKSIEITIEPGKAYVATSHTATIDTRGLSPGDYQVALGSAFWLPDADNQGTKYEIPHRGSMPLTILGEAKGAPARPLDNTIHWGDTISGLKLGAKFRRGTNSFAVGDAVEADLWIANVTDQPIECSIRLPHPMDGWLFNIENHLGNTIMLERPPLISSPLPQQFYEFKLAPGEVKALTGDQVEGQSDTFAGRCAKFEIVTTVENRPRRPTVAALTWGDPTIKGRLVTEGGNYSAIYNMTLERPDIPGMRIGLDTGNYAFTVGQPQVDPRVARVLDEATDKSILWGEPSGGMRLGLRQSALARRRTVLRHGEHLDYEVWIKNQTNEVVHIGRDPRDLHRPGMKGGRMINVIGSGIWLSFDVPPEVITKAELILPPGHSARRFLEPYHSASIRPPGSPRGRFGSDPLLLEPGVYTVSAQVGDLKSGVEEVKIISAARLQVFKSFQVTDKKREDVDADPSEAILTWKSGNGEKQEAMINWDGGVFIDERDVASVKIVPFEEQPDKYSISLELRPESAKWLSRHIASYSLWDDPDRVAILLDGKPLGAVRIPSPIPNDTLIIPVGLPLKQAETTIREIQAAMAVPVQPKAAPHSDTAASQPQGVKLVGEVKMPKDEWLFRRQVKQLPDVPPRERQRDFKGDTIDPVDGRLVHKLTWKDVATVNVTVKANDGRDYLKTVQTDQEGKFRFDEAWPIGSYQIDVNAVLIMDDDAQAIDGESAPDLRAGTQLLHVKQGDAGDKSFEFELYPVPYNHRVLHADPTQRTTLLGTLTENNQPVPNAKIELYGGIATRWKIAESRTNVRGQYRFENVMGNYIGVQVKHERLVPADGKSWRDLQIKFGTTVRLDLPLTRGGFITGKLLDDNKQPRANVPLRIMLTAPGVRKGVTNFVAYATTDDTGSFTSEPLYPGNYVIEENRKDYPVVGAVEVEASQTTSL